MEVANQGLLYVLLHELLLGLNKSIRGGGAVKRQLMNHEDTLTSALKGLRKTMQMVQVSHHATRTQ